MISLVIPCYNETAVLEQTYSALVSEVGRWTDPVEMVFVDDGSRDGTWEMIEALSRRDARVRGVHLSRNFGHQAAVGAGLERAVGNAVVILDADLQDPPHVIGEMIAQWRVGAQVVAACRTRRVGESLFKKVTGYLFYRLQSLVTNVRIPVDTGDFALLDRRVVEVMLSCPEQAVFWRGLRCYAGFRQALVHFDRPARAGGETKYTLAKLIHLASNGLLAYSEEPLRLPLYLGIAVMIGAILTAIGGLIAPSVGVSALGTSLFFLGGVQLTCLGVIGEYLNRIYAEVRRRPRWVVSDEVGREKSLPSAPAQAA